MALRFLVRSLTLRGVSFLLALLAVTTAATVTATMLNLEADLGAKMSNELRRYGPNLLVTPALAASGESGGENSSAAEGTTERTPPAQPTVLTLDEQAIRTLPAKLAPPGGGSAPSLSPLLIFSGAVMIEPHSHELPAPSRTATASGPPNAASDAGAVDGQNTAPRATSRVTEVSRNDPASATTRGLEDEPNDPASGTARAQESVSNSSASGPTTAVMGTQASDSLRGTAATATVVGCDFAALHEQNPSWRIEGAWPAPGERACVLGASLARRAGLATGGLALVWFGNSSSQPILQVAGIVSTGESADEQVFVPLDLAQAETGLQRRVSLAAIAIDGGAEGAQAAARTVEAAIPGASARPLRQIAAAQGEILGKLRRMMILLTAVVLTLSALCLTTTLMSAVIEREGEIGLMRSIGASDFEVLSMFLGEVSLLGLLGGLLGLGIGAGATLTIGARLFEAPIAPRLSVVPVVLIGSVVLCLLSVLVPLRRALSIQPAAALRGD